MLFSLLLKPNITTLSPFEVKLVVYKMAYFSLTWSELPKELPCGLANDFILKISFRCRTSSSRVAPHRETYICRKWLNLADMLKIKMAEIHITFIRKSYNYSKSYHILYFMDG
jgi:hypothetical protein